MKNFIKKYPKRIIFTALIVLLIAVIGTVNNYHTYRDVREKEHYLDDIIVEFMREIYGDITIKNYGYGYTQLYYNGELLGKRGNFRNKGLSAGGFLHCLDDQLDALLQTDPEAGHFEIGNR